MFAFKTPEEGPARLMRYVEPGALPGAGLVCVLDPTKNLLIINRELFDVLTPTEQSQILRTQRTSVTMAELGYPSAVPAQAA